MLKNPYLHACMQDYYKILGLEPGSDLESIHKAYRQLAKVYHPDLNNSEQANAFFILLNEAYTTLSDPHKKLLYDNQFQSWKTKKEDITRFHYDWNSMHTIHKTAKKRVVPGQIMQMVFGLEMFAGFMEALLILGYIFKGPLHPVYAVFCIPGILLVIDGWKGILGRKSLLGGIIKAIRRMI
ncbi:MAG: J domain-containing protein [Bacteroidia bacterium]